MREAQVNINSSGSEGIVGVESLNLQQFILNYFVIGRFELRKPRGNSYSTFQLLNYILLGPSNLILVCLIRGSKVLFELFEYLLNSITPSSILKVPTTNRLLNLSSQLVYSLNLRIIGLELIKVDSLVYLKVVLFRCVKGSKRNNL